jgi:hypothetical protein
MSTNLDFIKNHMLTEGQVTQDLLDYIDDRVREIVSDKLSQAMGDLEEQMRDKFVERGHRP